VSRQPLKGCRTLTPSLPSPPSTWARLRAWFPLTLAVLLPLVAAARAGDSEGKVAPRGAPGGGALVIVGGGCLTDEIWDRFMELAGGKQARIVVIPTAGRTDRDEVLDAYGEWRSERLKWVTVLHATSRREADDPEFVRPLTEATGVWFTGGDQSRLADAYRGTRVERELHRVLARGGVIGGTSAGAAVMSRVMIAGGNPEARLGTGFGLLPGVVVDQHFSNRKRLERLLGVLGRKEHADCLGLGIDEATAAVVRGRRLEVVGEANVSICVPGSGKKSPEVWRVLKPGQGADLLSAAASMPAVARSPGPSPATPAPARKAADAKRTALSD
jgi:cyanophycinase